MTTAVIGVGSIGSAVEGKVVVDPSNPIELPGGDLHENGGLGGRLLDVEQARAAVSASPATA